jgi:hypothetical protein
MAIPKGLLDFFQQLGPNTERFRQGLRDYSNRAQGITPAQSTSKRPDGYSTYGTYTVGGIEYDINSGRPTYMPPGSVYSSSSSASFSPAASQVRGGGGSPGPGSFAPIDPYAAQNREYERERARVEAMVKANPDMQKQAIADERAKVRDQGMAIWAAANPTLAKQVKPGAVGYDAIQQGLLGKDAGQAARQAFGYQTPQQITLTPPPGVNAPQSFPAVQSITPTETYGAQGLQTDPEMLKKFQALLNLTSK